MKDEVQYELLKEFIEFDKTEVGEIFQQLYDYEIALQWGWIWDSGMAEFIIGRINVNWPRSLGPYYLDPGKEFMDHFYWVKNKINERTVEEVLSLLAYSAACLYADFRRWYLEQLGLKKASGKGYRLLKPDYS